MKFASAIVATLTLLILFSPAQNIEEKITADSVLAELKSGNGHHVAHRYQHPHESLDRRRQLVSGQHPHAEILSCSDSRVPPEIVFDEGLGDLFIVRVAGNVVTDTVSLIKPAVEKTRGMSGDPVGNAVRMNVEMVVKQLRTSTPILSELVAHGQLRIVGAVYSIETGSVTWLPEVS